MRRFTRRSLRFVLFFAFFLAALTIAPRVFSGGSAMAQQGPRAPELEPNLGWLNSNRPLRFDTDLRGHVVLLDFWTYCCINCMQVLPDLEYLEQKYADEPFVVIGVHSAKFEAEGDRRSIRNAIHRYGIRHPVVIDREHAIWQKYGVRAWPSFVLIGADGRVIGIASGEGNRELLDGAIEDALRKGRQTGTLARQRTRIVLDGEVQPVGGLRFPGKVLGIPPSGEREGMLAVSDSSNHRVVFAGWPDASGVSRVLRVVGSGDAGLVDGAGESARFHDPQGLALDAGRSRVLVADTKNHAIRSIDLARFEVSTLVGDGSQGYDRRGGRSGMEQPLASPWDIEVAPDGQRAFIAMAGTHQIWELDLATNTARFLAGSGAENIVDGPAERAQLAQPSGLSLSSDGSRLYFADSETSAVRVLDLGVDRAGGRVRTLIGTGLFDFGDVDGMYPKARLQHPLDVEVWPQDQRDRLLVCDTYNSKIKILNPDERVIKQWLGVGAAGGDAATDLVLDEPGGMDLVTFEDGSQHLLIADTNHHRIVMVDVPSRAWREVVIEGLDGGTAQVPAFAAREPVTLPVDPGRDITLELVPDLPTGHTINEDFPAQVRLSGSGGIVLQRTITQVEESVAVSIPAGTLAAGGEYVVELSFASCEEGAGVCVPQLARWRVRIEPGDETRARLVP